MLALFGGWLGVLFMIPLRRQLIVEEHGNLAIPKAPPAPTCSSPASAAASSPAASSSASDSAASTPSSRTKTSSALGPALPTTTDVAPAPSKGAAIRADATPEYLGVGYIIGIRVAAIMLAGGVFSWLVLMPAIYFFGSHLSTPLYPGTVPIAQMSPSDLWRTYVRPMGAGGVAAAGLITLLRTLPTIVSALTQGFKKTDRQDQQLPALTHRARPSLPSSSSAARCFSFS